MIQSIVESYGEDDEFEKFIDKHMSEICFVEDKLFMSDIPYETQ